jgi:hypothetical protein
VARGGLNHRLMVISVRYFDLVREMKNPYNHRLRLAESAQQRGIKPTARLFATTVPTVRKWHSGGYDVPGHPYYVCPSKIWFR